MHICWLYVIHRRGVQDVIHKVTAVGSRNIDSARSFVEKLIDANERTKTYGDYTGVYNDPVCGIRLPLNLIEHHHAAAGR